MNRSGDEIPNNDDSSEEEVLAHLLNLPPFDTNTNETALVPAPQTDFITQTAQLPGQNIDEAPLFLNIPADVILIILRHLPLLADLRHFSWLNRYGHRLASVVRIERFRAILANSLLWRYLPVMARDQQEAVGVPFIEYYALGANVIIPPEKRQLYLSLSSFWTTLAGSRRCPNNWNGILINDWTDLQAMAKSIIRHLPPDLSVLPTNFHQFMNLCAPNYSPEEELALYQRYHALESLMSTLMLFLRMASIKWHNQLHQNQQIDWITILINPLHSCWLTGFGLIALDSYVPGIFSGLVREALRIFQRDQTEETKDQRQLAEHRLKGIECLLGRLEKADLLTYISPEDNREGQSVPDDPVDRQAYYDNKHADRKRRLFIDAIDANYEFLMGKLSEAVLFRIERSDYKRASLEKFRVIPRILNSRFLLSQFSKEGIAKILCLVTMNEKNDLINDHPVLHPFLTFDVLEAWMIEAKPNTFGYAKIILSQKELLAKMDNAQVVSIAQYLGTERFGALLNSPVFRERLDHDKATNDRGINNLLMQLAQLPEWSFDFVIATNPYTASLLTHDEIITLFKMENSIAYGELVKHESVLKKLDSAELLGLIDIHPTTSFHIASHHLRIFTNCDLVQFVRKNLHHLDRRPKFKILLETLPPVLAERSGSLTSSQWLEFGCIHPNLALIIPDNHIEQLVEADFAKLIAAHSENTLVREKISAICEERRKEAVKRQAEAEKIAEERRQREREQQLATIVVRRPEPPTRVQVSPPIALMTSSASKKPWRSKILEGLLIIVGLLGIGLLILGIASGIGIPIAVTITSALSFIPWSVALTAMLTGFFMHMIAGLCLAALSKNTEEFPRPSKKPAGSTLGFFELFGVSPEAQPLLENTKKPSSAKTVVAQPIVRQDARASEGFSPAKASITYVPESTQFKL